MESCKLRYFNSFEFFDHTRSPHTAGTSPGRQGLSPPWSFATPPFIPLWGLTDMREFVEPSKPLRYRVVEPDRRQPGRSLIAPGQQQTCRSATTDIFTAAIIFSIGCAGRTPSSEGSYSARRRAGLVPIWPALLVSILQHLPKLNQRRFIVAKIHLQLGSVARNCARASTRLRTGNDGNPYGQNFRRARCPTLELNFKHRFM